MALLATPAQATDLLVTIRGISAVPGTIMLTACPTANFPNGPCPFRVRAPARAGEVEMLLTDLPPGRIALKAFHDTDGNFSLGTDWLGRPTEGVAFGNDAPIGRFGPPTFDEAAIPIPASGRFRTTLTLRYR